MKILIQLGHPAQFHFFKNSINNWIANGHKVKVLIRTKDVLEDLLRSTNFDYVNIEKKRLRKNTKIQLIILALNRVQQLLKHLLSFRPNIVISPDPVLSNLCRFYPSKFLTVGEDDYQIIEKLANYLFPTVDHIIAPKVCDYSPWQNKKIEFDGYMKLAYLNPNYFVPQWELIKNNVSGNKYALIRLVALTAHHDVGITGINNNMLDRLIDMLEKSDYTIYISSEKEINNQYKKYQLSVPVHLMHHVMSFASFVICDSQSMAVEAAMLGVPSIRYNDFAGKISVLEELEKKYDLTYGVSTKEPEKLFELLDNLLCLPDIKNVFYARQQKMLADKIDVTAFLTWFIEFYPESAKIMKENPDYQYNFR